MDRLVAAHLQALERERQYCRQQHADLLAALSTGHLVRLGLVITALRATTTSSSLKMSGRSIVEVRKVDGVPIGGHQLRVGDLVSLSPTSARRPDSGCERNAAAGIAGIVAKIKDDCVEIAMEDPLDDPDAVYKATKMPNEVPFDRQVSALKGLLGSSTPVIEAAFAKTHVQCAPGSVERYFNQGLNAEQREAVLHALSPNRITLIHGPPGTGKTATLIECIMQLLQQKKRLLVCAPSNLAVDNIVERLQGHGVDMVRLGHPARILEHVQRHTLESIIEERAGDALADIRQSIKGILTGLPRASRAERRKLYEELKADRRELREREASATSQVLDAAPCVLCTLSGAGGRTLSRWVRNSGASFDAVVVDEGSQAMEGESWIAASLPCAKLVVAGDHCQLPPTITAPDLDGGVLGETLFERLSKMYEPVLLREQYRMHADIMGWSNAVFYGDRLLPNGAVRGHLLRDLDGVRDCDLTRTALLFIDTVGTGRQEDASVDESRVALCQESKSNPGEAEIAAAQVRLLLEAGLRPDQVAVITPYAAQVALIKSKVVAAECEVGTVDGFQGREKEAIVFSMVRSNPEGDIGFLGETRRTNVALTRARRHLCVIGDSETISASSGSASGARRAYARLVDYLYERGEVEYAEPLRSVQ